MSLPSLDITTNKDGVIRGFLTCDEYKAKGLLHTAMSVVDLITMLAKSAQDKETLDWIGETFWAENEKLKYQAGCLVDERDRLEAENEKAQTWVAEAQGKISALEGLLREANTLYVDGQKALQDVFTANEDQIRGLVRETRCLRGDIDAGHQEILRLETENEKLKEKLQSAHALNVEIFDSEAGFRKQNKALQEELEKAHAQARYAEDTHRLQVGSLVVERDRLEKKVGALVSALENLLKEAR